MSYVTVEDLALAGLFSVVGFLLCFFGYRLLCFSLFTGAFLGGSAFTATMMSIFSASGLAWGCVALAYKKPGVVAATSLVGATLLACVVAFCILLYSVVSTSTSDGNNYDYYYDNYEDYEDYEYALAPTTWILYAIKLALNWISVLSPSKVTGQGNRHERMESERQHEDDPIRYDNLQTPTSGSSLV